MKGNPRTTHASPARRWTCSTNSGGGLWRAPFGQFNNHLHTVCRSHFPRARYTVCRVSFNTRALSVTGLLSCAISLAAPPFAERRAEKGTAAQLERARQLSSGAEVVGMVPLRGQPKRCLHRDKCWGVPGGPATIRDYAGSLDSAEYFPCGDVWPGIVAEDWGQSKRACEASLASDQQAWRSHHRRPCFSAIRPALHVVDGFGPSRSFRGIGRSAAKPAPLHRLPENAAAPKYSTAGRDRLQASTSARLSALLCRSNARPVIARQK
jgi:hypothetical protein